MRKLIFIITISLCGTGLSAQIKVSEPRTWEHYPPKVQQPKFGLHKSTLAQLDDTPEEEEVLLFTADNGHYPYFDLFRCYYVIMGNYSKTVKYTSDVFLSTSRDLLLEDRNKDGVFELYRKYIKDGKFSVDAEGNHLKAEWLFDRIEWQKAAK
jgi:chitinase